MSHNHHGAGMYGFFAIVAAIAFAFGGTAARVVVGGGLIAVVLAFAYVMLRVIMGTI